jgi:hypothetical protein
MRLPDGTVAFYPTVEWQENNPDPFGLSKRPAKLPATDNDP